jgi:hypothetical protein
VDCCLRIAGIGECNRFHRQVIWITKMTFLFLQLYSRLASSHCTHTMYERTGHSILWAECLMPSHPASHLDTLFFSTSSFRGRKATCISHRQNLSRIKEASQPAKSTLQACKTQPHSQHIERIQTSQSNPSYTDKMRRGQWPISGTPERQVVLADSIREYIRKPERKEVGREAADSSRQQHIWADN